MYGTKIISIRTARGYSQQYVAKELGIAQNTYSNIENNENKKVADELLEKIATILGVRCKT